MPAPNIRLFCAAICVASKYESEDLPFAELSVNEEMLSTLVLIRSLEVYAAVKNIMRSKVVIDNLLMVFLLFIRATDAMMIVMIKVAKKPMEYVAIRGGSNINK